MSKKNPQLASKKKKQPQKKRVSIALIVGICAVALVLCGAGGWFLYQHLSEDDTPTIRDYNVAVTNRALSAGEISEDEVLITRTVTVREGDVAGYVLVEFNIYKLPKNADTTKILAYQVSDIPENSGLELVGTASARLLNGKVTVIYDLSVTHNK